MTPINSSLTINTKFGIAKPNAYGYYQITTRKEGNHRKYLHRLVFEDFYQIKLSSNIAIHHYDGDKSNNNIWNLIPMSQKEHNSLHKTIHDNFPKDFDKPVPIANVTKHKTLRTTQGFDYRYCYMENGKKRYIHSISLEKLEKKVKSHGLEWRRLDE